MIGGLAEVLDDFDGLGRVRAFGEIWQARGAGSGGVQVFAADGSKTRFIEIPKPMCTNRPSPSEFGG